MAIEFKPVSDALGAEVKGINVADDHSAQEIAEVRKGWLKYGILLFRNQNLTVEQQKRFATKFGKLMGPQHPNSKPKIPEHPEVGVFSNIQVDGKYIGARPDRSHGDAWHSDASFLAEPAGGSFFYAKETPEKGGDDTWYANMVKAYAALPEETKEKLRGLSWTYSHIQNFKFHKPDSPEFSEKEKHQLPDVTHPFVRTHPETGEKVLFVGVLDSRVTSVPGMSKVKGTKFLDELRSFATQPQFTYAHPWKPGDCILWDNRCTMHRGSNFPESNGRRLCYRVTTHGGVPY